MAVRSKGKGLFRGNVVQHRIDFRDRPVGSFVGGKQRLTVECPKCHRGCVKVRDFKLSGYGKTERMSEYAHVVEFYLDSKNEPVPVYSTTCSAPA
jgi:hypothetical protein